MTTLTPAGFAGELQGYAALLQPLARDGAEDVVAERGQQCRVQAESRATGRGDRGGTAEHQVRAGQQLLGLTETGAYIAAQHQVRVGVTDHEHVHCLSFAVCPNGQLGLRTCAVIHVAEHDTRTKSC